jgi:hypothetical protein
MAANQQPILVPPDPAPPAQPPRKLPANLQIWSVTIILILAAAKVGTIPVSGYSWIGMLLIIFVFVLFLGHWICGRPLGILVMERNLMSLSRFQIILWTLLILSAYLTIAMQRIHAGMPDALNFGLDPKLWALLGISTASLVGSPLLLQSKKTQDPSDATVNKAAELLGENQADIQENREGRLYSNGEPKDARFTDMFQGDLVGNTAYIDPAKLQMFLFTLIVAASYGYSIFHAMYGDPKTLAMPPVSEGMVALLGISHAGYLGSKAAG